MNTKKDKSGNIFDFQLLKRVLGLAQPYRSQFYGSTFLAISLALLAIFRPVLTKKAMDDYIMQFDGKGLLHIVIIMVVILMLESLMRYFFIYTTRLLGQSVIKDLRVRMFKHIVGMRLTYFDKTAIGTSTTRTVNDIETINDIFAQGIINIIADVLTIVAIIVAMLWMNWKLALISLITMPLLLYATYLFKESVKSAFQKVRNEISRLNAFLQEHISGMRIVQIFNAERHEMAKFKAINKAQTDAHIEAIWAYSIFFPVVEILLAAAIGLMVWWGAGFVINGEMEIGVIVAFILFINMLFRPLRFIADRFNTLQMGLVAGDRVFSLLDQEERISRDGTAQTTSLEGRIAFENVWFAYNKDEFVLKDLNFKVNPGETVALVGSTGSGKTSIINVLSRFYEINKGIIRVDGLPIQEYDLHNLRTHIAVVLQDVFLFSGSVYENINLRNDEISLDEVVSAAKSMGAHEFISNLPNGYQYNVMERGATLSMGQRQLISFVRTLVHKPAILVLDEATSNIDSHSELLIQQAIEKMVKGRTSLVIAHRLSTIQHADKIIVLDKGEIVEMGTNEELLAKEGFYRNLYDMQFNQKKSA